MSNELTNIGIRVVERQNLTEVLSEQELTELGIVRKDKNAAKKAQMKGAEFIILGGVSAYEDGVERTSSGSSQKFLGFGGNNSNAESKAYIALDLRVVDSTTGEIIGSRTVEGRATSTSKQKSSGGSLSPVSGIIKRNFGVSNTGGAILDVAGTYEYGKTSSESNKTPTSKAIRAAIISGADYVNCILVLQDGCAETYKRQDAKRRSKTLDVLELE